MILLFNVVENAQLSKIVNFMRRKYFKIFVLAFILSFCWFLIVHQSYNKYIDRASSNLITKNANEQDVSLTKVEEQSHYLNDKAPLSNNTYQGDLNIKAELQNKVNLYNDVRNFHAYDYSNARTKLDIIPNYKNYMEIDYTTESGGLKGDSSTTYSINGKVKLKTYSTTKDGKLFLDAGFLATFLDDKNIKIFKNDLKSKNMNINSFISARIEHGKHTFDNMDPNYFSSLAYLNRMRTEFDTLNFENITKINDSSYELSNTNHNDLPLMVGYQVVRFKTILTFTSSTSFTLERKANKLTYIKVEFHNRPVFKPLTLPTADIDELMYYDNFVSPDVTM